MPDYEKLADEVRALIASRAFRTPEVIEDLLQLAAWYDARANQHSAPHHRSGTNLFSSPAPLRFGDETPIKALIPKG